MARTIQVVLGEQERQVPVLTRQAASAWRRLAAEKIAEFTPLAEKLMAMADSGQTVEFSDLGALVSGLARPLLVDSLDTVAELLAAYAPEMAGVIDEAYDDEVLDAFVEVVKSAFPFESARTLIRTIGSTTKATGAS